MQLSCSCPPGPRAVEYAQLAEQLGYARIWLYDSPLLYPDVWMTLARIGDATRRIGLRPGGPWPSPRPGPGRGDRDARSVGAWARRGRDRHRLHGPAPARRAAARVEGGGGVRAGGARAPAPRRRDR